MSLWDYSLAVARLLEILYNWTDSYWPCHYPLCSCGQPDPAAVLAAKSKHDERPTRIQPQLKELELGAISRSISRRS